VCLHQQVARYPYAHTHADADAHTHAYTHAHAYAYADVHAHSNAHAYADIHAHADTHAYTDTQAVGDTSRAAYTDSSYPDGGSCHAHASGAAVDRRQWLGAILYGLALGYPFVGRCCLDASGHGGCSAVAEAAK
jgi:hypothetical protein